MDDRYDVIVVGARVAGAATALHLARAGHDVVVVDRAGPPSDTTSTHAIMRTGVLQLQRAGLLDRIIAAGTPPIRHVDLAFGAERISFGVKEEYGVDSYYAPRRTVLDQVLLEEAVAAGARFLPGVSMLDVTRDDSGRVAGIVARAQGGVQSISARLVVGADGTRSRTARAVGAPILRRHRPANSVVYGYFQGVPASGYEFRFVEQRNVGLVPTNDGLTLTFVGGPCQHAPRDGQRYLFETLRRVAPDMAEAVTNGERVGRLHRADHVAGVLRVPGGPGWALVGDAGFTEDPISAHGISDALRDAELCAEAMDISLQDPGAEAEALATYRARRDRFAIPLWESTVPLAGFDWDGARASQLMRQLGQVVDDECQFLSERRPASVAAA